MEVKIYVPPPAHPLHSYIHSIWRARSAFPLSHEVILPKGIIDIVFNLETPPELFSCKWSNAPVNTGYSSIAGIQTGAIRAQPGGNSYGYGVGISFKLETCKDIFPVPISELTDKYIETKFLFKDVNEVWGKLSDTQDFNKQCLILENWLMKKIKPAETKKIILYSSRFLRNEPVESNLYSLARSLGISSRHLRRLFHQHIGISPSHYLRLSRFIKTVYLIPGSDASLTEIANRAYYTDQAHFCRDFKEIAGMTPVQYKKAVGKVPGHIFQDMSV